MSSFAPILQKLFPSISCEKNYSMKRIKFTYILGMALSFLLLFQSTEARATHIMGGDLTYTCLGGSTYMMQIRLFRDCNGIALGNTANITLSSPSCGTQTIGLNLLNGYPIVITPLCPNEPDRCVNGFGTYGVEEYVYKGPITLSGCWANASDITISWSSCCRNNAITTLSPPGATYISTDLDATLSPCNSSPDFLNSPIAFFCVNEQVNYNHGATDQDGDSLAFSLVNCRASAGGSSGYVNPYSGTNPLSTVNGITIDPTTGGLQFTPNSTQVGVVCVLVEEYRNGVKVGEVVRDMQFTIITCNNDLPIASGMDGTAGLTGATGSYNITVCAGDTVQFDVVSYDKNIIDNVLIQGPQNVVMGWNQAITGAAFNITASNPPTGSFFWIPSNSDVGNRVFTVDVSDDGCPVNGVNIYSYLITVLERPEMDAGAYQVTCSPGDTVALNATFTTNTGQSGSFVWSPAAGIADTSAAMTNAGPDSTTTYLTQVTYSNGCTYADSVIIEVTDGITLPDFTDTTICQGGVQLDAAVQTTSTGGAFFANDSLKAIPDNDPNGVYSYIDVSGVSPAAMSATTIDTVCVTINHIWDSDVDIYLVSPDGIVMELSTDNGGGNSNYTNACFSPSATQSVVTGTAPFTGTFLPEGSFAGFNGSATNGIWKLFVVDDGAFFTGTLMKWSIKFADPNQVTYSWSPTSNLTCTNCPDPLATPPSTTTYTVTGTNQNGCIDTSAITITVNDTIAAPIIQCSGITPNSLVFCWDTLDGVSTYEVNIDNTGWTTPSGPGTNCHSITGLSVSQTVNIQVRGITSCPAAVVLIGTQNCTTAPCTLAGSLGGTTNVSCNSGNDGSVVVTASGGTPLYQFSIDGMVTFQPTGGFNNLTAGNYTVHVIDAFLCQDSVLFTITEPTAIALAMSADSVSCFNGNDGTATVVATGGTGAYTYAWSGVTGGIATITSLTAGTYVVTVTDANNCVAIDSIVVGEPDTLALSTTAFDVSCNGASDGSVTVAATGGNGVYTYAWTGSASTSNLASNLNGGIYTVTVTDSKGCFTVISDTINENSAVVLDTDSIPALCNTSSDGSAIVIVTGGAGNYTYLWDAAAGNQVTDTAFNVSSGSYTVTVTDGDGCFQTITATVTAPSAMGVTLSSTPALCHNSADGTASVVATGGVGSYTYAWNTTPVQITATATALLAGFHTVTVTDGNGCTIVDSVQVNGPTPISIALAPVAVTCFGNSDGAISSTVSGGAGSYTYAWSNTMATTANLANISGGTYIVTVTDANGCSDTASTFVPEPVSLIITLDSIDVSCFNGSDGQAQVTATGGTLPYVYLWSPSNQSTSIASNISAGWHTVSVTDASGCAAIDSVFVNQPATGVTTSTSFTPLNCNGDGSGTATVVAVGGSGNYTYAWSTTPVQNTATATGLQAGPYTVTVTDMNGCTYVDNVTVTEPTPVTATTGMEPANCNGYADGSAVVTPSGGVGGYTYAWSTTPVQTDSLANNLAAGTYTVTVTDANNCTIIETVIVTEPSGMTSTMSMNPVNCYSGNDGDATVGVTGGTSPYLYNWSSSAITPTASTLSAGWQYVTITDANGCFKVDSIEVTEPDTLTVALTAIDVSCFAGSDGSVNVIGTGGTGTYTYAWNTSPTQNTQTATGVPTGTYTVTVTDQNGCIATGSVFVNQPATGVTTSTSFTPLNCNGDGSGTATVTAVGGSGNYTYAWSTTPVQNTATATGLQAGPYSVTVTDINGCTYIDNVTVTEPTPVVATTGMAPASCNGYADGSAVVTPSGGVGGYTYAWSTTPVQTDSLANNLAAGTYTVTVTDANNCTIIETVVVTEPSGMTLTMSMNPVNCHSGNDGDATVGVTGGTSPYLYNWSSSAITPTASTLSAGWHTVTITDANGCFKVDSIEVTEPDTLTVTLSAIDVSCFGGSDGSVNVIGTGGTGTYTYAWNTSPIQNTQTATGVLTGTYTVTVTDQNGCIATGSVFVGQPASGVTTTTVMTPVNCNGGNDGTATVSAVGGAGSYTYLWSNNQNSPTATGLTAGTYTVTVTDQNGCFTTNNITVDEPSAITLIVGQSSTSCFGGNDGTATVVGSGGVPNANGGYSYLWNSTPVQNTATAIGLNGGQTYTVTVTDENGCVETSSITISQPSEVLLTTVQTNVSCNGFADGTATVTPGGGTPGYTFQWDANAGSQTTAVASNLPVGIFEVTVTDFNNCSAEISVNITEPSPLAVTSIVENVICKGASTGTAQILAAGGTPWYSFQWDANAGSKTSNIIDGLAAGSYTVTMTDANSCEIVETITVTEPDEALVATYNPMDVSCFGDRDGEIVVSASGGAIPYKYSLDGNNYSNSNSLVGLTSDEYIVYVRDDMGCVYTDTVIINEPAEIIVNAGPDLLVEYGSGVSIVVQVQNGQIPYLYNWLPADSTAGLSCDNCPVPIASPLQDVYYQVQVIDANGCIAYDEIAVRVQKVREVYVATGFTPNNDGINDFLFVQGGDQTTKVIEFNVYDRWGEKVYNVADADLNEPTLGWDGRFKGQLKNPGVYGWTAVVEFVDGERIVYKGNTTLVR